MLSKAGVHEPIIPLFELVGSDANVTPAQIAGMDVKEGVTVELTIISIVVVLAQNPGSGVKV